MDVLALYELDNKASVSGYGIRRWTQFFLNSLAAVTVTALSESSPLDMVTVVNRVAYIASAGAAQTILAAGAFPQAQLQIVNNLGTDPRYTEAYYEGAGLASYGVAREVELILMPGEELLFAVNFSAGANPNVVQAFAHGYQIPRGNFRF